jgi:2-hydroxychromene-2-carboxylate isomerase
MARLSWYFDFVSPFAYLQFAAYPDLFRRADLELKPVVFAGLLNHWGHKGPAEIGPKRLHTYRHTQWQAAKRNIALKYPPGHPFNSLQVLRLAIALGGEYAAVRTIFDFIWAEGRSPQDDWPALCDALHAPEAEALVGNESVKAQLRENGAEAISRGVFGVPTFVADTALFWGLDATEMLLDYLADPQLFDTAEMRRLATLPAAAARKI